MQQKKVLFILKRREDYNADKHSHIGLSTGLYNSASFMNQMLVDAGVESHLEVVEDNNKIDKYVTQYRPTHVIIEALWVVPSKFAILCKLHPTVKWIIRLHSEMPFLAGEGMALDWIGDYVLQPNILIGVNAPRALGEVKDYLGIQQRWSKDEINKRIIYLPNFYPQEYKFKEFDKNKDWIDISCFGAIRPLKNHVIQAIAAIKFAESLNKKLRFHINSGRIEMKGDSALNNLIGLFSHMIDNGHQLINHLWTPREEFLELCSKMDIGMQVSFSETFNIVGADLVTEGVPLVASDEIPWADVRFCAKPTETEDIFEKLKLTYNKPQMNVQHNQKYLNNYTNKTRKIWLAYFGG